MRLPTNITSLNKMYLFLPLSLRARIQEVALGVMQHNPPKPSPKTPIAKHWNTPMTQLNQAPTRNHTCGISKSCGGISNMWEQGVLPAIVTMYSWGRNCGSGSGGRKRPPRFIGPAKGILALDFLDKVGFNRISVGWAGRLEGRIHSEMPYATLWVCV